MPAHALVLVEHLRGRLIYHRFPGPNGGAAVNRAVHVKREQSPSQSQQQCNPFEGFSCHASPFHAAQRSPLALQIDPTRSRLSFQLGKALSRMYQAYRRCGFRRAAVGHYAEDVAIGFCRLPLVFLDSKKTGHENRWPVPLRREIVQLRALKLDYPCDLYRLVLQKLLEHRIRHFCVRFHHRTGFESRAGFGGRVLPAQ
jgi:hypothetical protein